MEPPVTRDVDIRDHVESPYCNENFDPVTRNCEVDWGCASEGGSIAIEGPADIDIFAKRAPVDGRQPYPEWMMEGEQQCGYSCFNTAH